MALRTTFLTTLLRVAFDTWRLFFMIEINAHLRGEETRLRKLVGKKANSIWMMNKDSLSEVAVNEVPGLSRDACQKMRKAELQFVIKTQRDSAKPDAPVSTLPKGLARMTHQQLMALATERNIVTEDASKRYGVKVREQLIRDIKTYEAAKAKEAANDLSSEDFTMEDGTAYCMPRPRPAKGFFAASAASSQGPIEVPEGVDETVRELVMQIRQNPGLQDILRNAPELVFNAKK